MISSSHWNSEIEKSESGRQPRLIVAILKCTWWRILLHGVMMLAEVAVFYTTYKIDNSNSDAYSDNCSVLNHHDLKWWDLPKFLIQRGNKH